MSERLVPYDLGTTAVDGELDHLLGYEAKFTDFLKSATGVKTQRSGMTVKALWVKNGIAGTVAPKMCVTWTAGSAGTVIGALAGASEKIAGVVDPYVSGTVAQNAHFWLIVDGPCEVVTDGSETISAGSPLVVGGSGKVELLDGTGDVTEALAYVGQALENPAETDNTAFRAVIHATF